MKFLIDKDYAGYEKEITIQILNRNKYIHEYEIASVHDIMNDDSDSYKDYIPVGTIKFNDAFYKKYYNIEQINPIEIPLCLRSPKFTKRDYFILEFKNLPEEGFYFLKDASSAKSFSNVCDLYNIFAGMDSDSESDGELKSVIDSTLHFDEKHYFQLSEPVHILSEYRVYIVGGDVKAVVNYAGDPLIFPDRDLIEEANAIYSKQPDYPRSYSLDVMITPRGTSIIEVHTFEGLGLYHCLWDDELLYALKDARNYIVNHNTPQQETKVVWKDPLGKLKYKGV